MKIVLQRVKSAKIYEESALLSSIKNGYLLLVGISRDENTENLKKMVTKILNIKLFEDWKKNIVEMDYEIMVLSQFTLFAQFKGNKPDFHLAEEHHRAKKLFIETIDLFRKGYSKDRIKNGIFGVHLDIELVNDGPVTMILEI